MIIKRKIETMLMSLVLVTVGVMASGSASAAAGKVLFTTGDAYAERNGERVALRRGSEVNQGDKLITGPRGRLQMRMADKALFNLRPNTEFRIDEFKMPAATTRRSSKSGRSVTSASDEGRSFMTLVRGGFRTISGLIGKKDRSAYRIASPVANMGIRGTIYEALYCDPCISANQENGGQVEEKTGLHVAVLDGAVAIENEGGEIVIQRGEFGFVGSKSGAPSKSDESPGVFDESGSSDSVDKPEQADQPSPLTPPNARGSAFGLAGNVGSKVGDTNLALDAAGNLVRFAAPYQGSTGLFEISGANNVNTGSDPTTGLRWGRWQGGTALVRLPDGTVQALDLSNQSLHWVVGPDQENAPVLPTTGTATYAQVGGTTPTDSSGAAVTAASATLNADFTNQAVTSIVNATTAAGRSFQATGTAGISTDATFVGAYSVVETTGGTSTGGGQGQFSGFFTGATGEGAGKTFSISSPSGDETVTGAGAFERQ